MANHELYREHENLYSHINDHRAELNTLASRLQTLEGHIKGFADRLARFDSDRVQQQMFAAARASGRLDGGWTLSDPEQVAPKDDKKYWETQSMWYNSHKEVFEGLARDWLGATQVVYSSPSTVPYEFCWKVCKCEDDGRSSNGWQRSAIQDDHHGGCDYKLRFWTIPHDHTGPLTAFDSRRNAMRFQVHMGVGLDKYRVYLALGLHTKGTEVWSGTYNWETSTLLSTLPEGTRLYDRIMLLEEVK